MSATARAPAPEPPKGVCRSGLGSETRRTAWFALATTHGSSIDASHTAADLLAQGSARYQHALLEVFGNTGMPNHCYSVPVLGSELVEEEAGVPPTRLAAQDRIVCTLSQQYSLQYFPQVPSLVSAFLTYMSEVEAFCAVERLVTENLTSDMLISSPRLEEAFVVTFMSLARDYYPKTGAYLATLGDAGANLVASWFRGFFSGWLPSPDVHRVIDAYLCEGPKALIRFGLGLLRLTKRRLKRCPNADEASAALHRWLDGMSGDGFARAYSFEALAQAAFEGIPRLSRTAIRARMGAHLVTGRSRSLGPAALAAAAATTADSWHSPKIIGVSTRLASATYEPVVATELRAAVAGCRALLRRGLYEPESPTPDTAAPVASAATPRPPATAWLTGLYGSAGAGAPAGVIAAEVGVFTSTPQLAALGALLPRRVSHHNWACVYSTDRQGRSLDALLRHVGGVAPVLVVMQLQLRGLPDCPVLGFYSTHGLPVTADGVASLPSARSRGGGRAIRSPWVGSRDDFVFRLSPAAKRIAVSPSRTASSPTDGAEGAAEAASPEAAEGAAGGSKASEPGDASLPGGGSQPLLARDRFLLCSREFLIVGSPPAADDAGPPAAGAARVPALILRRDLDSASASRALLRGLDVPADAAAAAALPAEAEADVLWLEAFAFAERDGAFLHASPDTEAPVRQAFRRTLERFWTGGEATGDATGAVTSLTPEAAGTPNSARWM